jgi:hypothetical protein
MIGAIIILAGQIVRITGLEGRQAASPPLDMHLVGYEHCE